MRTYDLDHRVLLDRYREELARQEEDESTCRAYRRHCLRRCPQLSWTYKTDEPHVHHITWICLDCGTIAHDFLDYRYQRVIPRKYLWPDGYLKAKDEEATPREQYFMLMLGIKKKRRRAA